MRSSSLYRHDFDVQSNVVKKEHSRTRIESLFMLLRLFKKQNFSRGYCASSLFTKMQNLNVKFFEGNSNFQLSFQFEDPNTKLLRVFNFSRPASETVLQTSEKIKNNIEKLVNKQYRKQKLKHDDLILSVAFVGSEENKSMDINTVEALKMIDCKIKIMEQEYIVKWNTPTIVTMKMPSSIMAGFPCYPSKLEIECGDRNRSSFRWFKSKTTLKQQEQEVENYNRQWTDRGKKPPKPMKLVVPDENDNSLWTFLGTGFSYLAADQDIGHWLLLECVPKNSDKEGCPVRAVSQVAVSAGPGFCPFETRQQFTTQRTPQNGFRVVTYNILADLYADQDYTRQVLHPYCPPYALQLDYRKQLYLKELTGYNADIMCMQEVDSKVFDLDLVPVFESQGFSGVFDKKGGQVSEGLACFYRLDKFRLVHTESLILGEEISKNPIFKDIWEAVQRNKDLEDRVIQRTTALQATVLESVLYPNRWILVGNTHLYFHPDADHIRLLQGGMGILFLENLVKSLKNQNPEKDIALLFSGDFNSSPSNGVLELMRNQHIPANYSDWSSNFNESIENLLLTNPIKMESSCGTPKYTNYTEGFKDCLDYIFYQVEKLRVTQAVPLPSDEELSAHVALPSVVFPSDHVSLVADFEWKL